jgi:photosystem II stability/assembly factor-like uncharacterized protein
VLIGADRANLAETVRRELVLTGVTDDTAHTIPAAEDLLAVNNLSHAYKQLLGEIVNSLHRTFLCLVSLLLLLIYSPLHAQDSRLDAQDVEPNMIYRAVHAADSNHCIAVGSVAKGLAIKRTSDGGKTWSMYVDTSWSFQGLLNQPREVAYPTPNLCIVVGDSGLVLRSSDGGANWQKIPTGIPYPLRHIAMCDSLHGIIPIGPLDPLATTDGGLTWQRIPFPPEVPDHPNLSINGVAYPTPNDIIYLRQSYPAVFTSRTSDGGKTWTHAPADSIARVYYVDATHGWGCGRGLVGHFDEARDIIARTTGGAENWETVLDKNQEPAFGLVDIAFADYRHGIAIASSKLLRTIDGGDTWVDLARVWGLGVNGQDPFIRVTYPVPSKAWIVAPAIGAIYAYSGPASSDVPGRGEEPASALQVLPNPIHRSGTIRYYLDASTQIRLSIVDEHGSEVAVLEEGKKQMGEHRVEFDAGTLAAATYFVRLEYPQHSITSAMTVVR